MLYARAPSGLRSLTRSLGPGRLSRDFSHTARALVKAGDAIPAIELREGSPGNKVDIKEVFAQSKGRGVVIGVPAAFSPSCTASHVPGYLKHPKLKDAGSVIVVSVNDPFVTKAWGESLDPNGKSNIRFLADPAAEFTKAMDLAFDSSAIFGNDRSKRYALLIEDGKVKKAFVEPDNIGVDVSAAEKVLSDW